MKKSLNELRSELNSYNSFFIDTIEELDQYITTDENIKNVMTNQVCLFDSSLHRDLY